MIAKLISISMAVATAAVVSPLAAYAHEAPPAAVPALSQIDEQVWRPLLQAMNSMDADRFIAILSTDVVQISYDHKQIRNRDEFVALIRESYARGRERGTRRSVEFRSLGRIESGPLAYESGYIKTTFTTAAGEVKISYGAFQSVMRREQGGWKLLVDYDASTMNSAQITDAMFAQAPLLGTYR
jgi:ketosteroid isomerase-like protein